jgi:transposase InsO family protein
MNKIRSEILFMLFRYVFLYKKEIKGDLTMKSIRNRTLKVNKLQGEYLSSSLNQVWTIDITTIKRKYYWFFVMDLASRRIVYHSVSEHDFNSLQAVEILDQALKIENEVVPYRQVKMIHTDSGGIFLSHNSPNSFFLCFLYLSMVLIVLNPVLQCY